MIEAGGGDLFRYSFVNIFPDGDFDASNLVAAGDLNLVLFNWNVLGADLPGILSSPFSVRH